MLTSDELPAAMTAVETLVPTYRKADPPAIAANASAEDALTAIVLGGVAHLRANEACVLARADIEGIHQMRVAVRRLRSSLALYDELLPPQQTAYLTAELRWLIGELGPARDWDVFLSETLAKVLAAVSGEAALKDLKGAAADKRDEAYQRAEAALRSQRYLGLVMLLGAWAEGRRWHDPGTTPPGRPDAMHEPAERIAHALLDQRYETVRHAGRRFSALGPAGRHKLRIQIKKLRYATDFFGSLYEPDRLAEFYADLKGLQDRLGVANDIDVARRLVKALVQPRKGKERARLSYAAGLVVGWHSHVAGDRETGLRLAWRRFLRRPPYWETARTRANGQDGERDLAPTPSPATSGTNGAAPRRRRPAATAAATAASLRRAGAATD
ncbi:MAG: CHAD domain-containing protein [Rhodospirillales bacterium]|nr:CHAD domain-containing protein [Rhodospirillales bacterium]